MKICLLRFCQKNETFVRLFVFGDVVDPAYTGEPVCILCKFKSIYYLFVCTSFQIRSKYQSEIVTPYWT